MSDSMRLNKERRRAEEAYSCAQDASTQTYAEEYKSLVMKTPMRIKTSGLSATIAFMFAKAGVDGHHNLLYTQLDIWLRKTGYLSPQYNQLCQAVIFLENSEYRAVTIETLAFFAWLRRFSDGLIEKKTVISNVAATDSEIIPG